MYSAMSPERVATVSRKSGAVTRRRCARVGTLCCTALCSPRSRQAPGARWCTPPAGRPRCRRPGLRERNGSASEDSTLPAAGGGTASKAQQCEGVPDTPHTVTQVLGVASCERACGLVRRAAVVLGARERRPARRRGSPWPAHPCGASTYWRCTPARTRSWARCPRPACNGRIDVANPVAIAGMAGEMRRTRLVTITRYSPR